MGRIDTSTPEGRKEFRQVWNTAKDRVAVCAYYGLGPEKVGNLSPHKAKIVDAWERANRAFLAAKAARETAIAKALENGENPPEFTEPLRRPVEPLKELPIEFGKVGKKRGRKSIPVSADEFDYESADELLDEADND